MMRGAAHTARMGEFRNEHEMLVGKAEGKRLRRKPRRRWKDNIKFDLRDRLGGCGLNSYGSCGLDSSGLV
jgi:hypothetical protein